MSEPGNYYTKQIELSETFRQWVLKYNAALADLTAAAQSGLAEYNFLVIKGVGATDEPPPPDLGPSNKTIPQSVLFTRSRLEGSTRITQHIVKDHTGEEILIYETTEVL